MGESERAWTTSEKLDHMLRSYGRLEKRMYEVKRESRAWRGVAHELAEALRPLQTMSAPGSPRRKRIDPILARFDALNTEEQR